MILHEISHGVVALWFGDDTAKRAGRLTLNPVPHIDPFGSIILPALGALTGFPVLAFAKPVPGEPQPACATRGATCSPYRSRARRRTCSLMALAAVVTRSLYRGDFSPTLVDFAFAFAIVNLFLGLFNLLPIPPLDGSAILERLLPPRALPGWYKFRPYGMLVLFLLVFSVGFPGRAFEPFLDRLREFIVQ